MDLENLVELVNQSKFPFVYSSERLNDEKCQKALKEIGADTNVLAVITSHVPGAGDMIIFGVAILKTGIKFSVSGGYTEGTFKVPKSKGEYSFNDFTIHDVTVSSTAGFPKLKVLPNFDVIMVIWDNRKKKPFNFHFTLEPNVNELDDEMKEELENILKCLVTKTGTEYVPVDQQTEKNGNEFDFVWGSLHTTITINDADIVIKKQKIDDKTKIQTPKGELITIARSAIGSVKIKRVISPVQLLLCMGGSALIGFALIGGVYVLLLGTILGLVLSFPKAMFIYRKDGTKYKTVISGDDNNMKEYDRLMNVIFQ